MNTISKLDNFGRLPAGWHYGAGVPPSAELLAQARQIVALYLSCGAPETDAFCGSEGEVMVTAYVNGHYLESDCNVDFTVNFLHENPFGVAVERVVVSHGQLPSYVRKAFQGALGNKWLSFDSLTRPAMTIDGKNSTTMLSRTQARTVAPQYSRSSVRSRTLQVYARTSKPIIQELVASHLHFGGLNYRISNQAVAHRYRVDISAHHQETNAITISRVPAIAIYAG